MQKQRESNIFQNSFNILNFRKWQSYQKINMERVVQSMEMIKEVHLSDGADYVECNYGWFIASTVKGQHILS